MELHYQGQRIGDCAVQSFSITAIAALPTREWIAVSGDDRSLHLYELPDNKTMKLFNTLRDLLKSPATVMAFSPDGSYLAVGTSSGGISIFETADWSLVTSRWSAHSARVTSIAWSLDSRFAASGSLDTNIFVWSLANPGMRVKAGNAHKEGVNGVVWQDKLLSVGADAAIKTWRVDGLS